LQDPDWEDAAEHSPDSQGSAVDQPPVHGSVTERLIALGPVTEEVDDAVRDLVDEGGRRLLKAVFGNRPDRAVPRSELRHAIASLTPREGRVLCLRFGLNDGEFRTLEEVGREYNVTRERIRQIQVKAVRRLRHPIRSKRLREFL